ncbi:glycosyl hydrolase family protein [Cryobacterium levicorallinum]|uniref:Glycosyl hydrolase family protein n=3 Tax=Cryobacterium TaxID=69578 RepID=A0A4R8VME7_9MICO|nr:glycosyl hydrolase family protein [Cryobacterium levicorallinum]
MMPGSEGQAGTLRPVQDEGNDLIGDFENEGRLNGCSALLRRVDPERGGPRAESGQGVVGGAKGEAGGIRFGQFEQNAHAVGPGLHRAGEQIGGGSRHPAIGFERDDRADTGESAGHGGRIAERGARLRTGEQQHASQGSHHEPGDGQWDQNFAAALEQGARRGTPVPCGARMLLPVVGTHQTQRYIRGSHVRNSDRGTMGKPCSGLVCRGWAGVGAPVKDGIEVLGYEHWSALDNYECASGFRPTLGLIEVDHETFVRTPKPSLAWLAGSRGRTGWSSEGPSRPVVHNCSRRQRSGHRRPRKRRPWECPVGIRLSKMTVIRAPAAVDRPSCPDG